MFKATPSSPFKTPALSQNIEWASKTLIFLKQSSLRLRSINARPGPSTPTLLGRGHAVRDREQRGRFGLRAGVLDRRPHAAALEDQRLRAALVPDQPAVCRLPHAFDVGARCPVRKRNVRRGAAFGRELFSGRSLLVYGYARSTRPRI